MTLFGIDRKLPLYVDRTDVEAVCFYVENKCEAFPAAKEVSDMTGVYPVICEQVLSALEETSRRYARKHGRKRRISDYLDG